LIPGWAVGDESEWEIREQRRREEEMGQEAEELGVKE